MTSHATKNYSTTYWIFGQEKIYEYLGWSSNEEHPYKIGFMDNLTFNNISVISNYCTKACKRNKADLKGMIDIYYTTIYFQRNL